LIIILLKSPCLISRSRRSDALNDWFVGTFKREVGI
jgi:hypothetical protein